MKAAAKSAPASRASGHPGGCREAGVRRRLVFRSYGPVELRPLRGPGRGHPADDAAAAGRQAAACEVYCAIARVISLMMMRRSRPSWSAHSPDLAMLSFRLQRDQRQVSEHGVIAPRREQLALPGDPGARSLTRRTISLAVIALPVLDANAVYVVSATSVSDTQRPA